MKTQDKHFIVIELTLLAIVMSILNDNLLIAAVIGLLVSHYYVHKIIVEQSKVL